jgi:hypothetical protein
VAICVFQQLTGQNTINAYIISFFVSFRSNQSADQSLIYSFIASYVIGVVGFLFSLLGAYTMIKCGRKPLLLGCQIAMGVSLVGTGILVFFNYGEGAMAAFTVFTAFLQMGSGSIAWPYRAEVALEDVALFCYSCSHMTTLVLSAAMEYIFISLIGPATTYFIFGGLTMVGAIFIGAVVRETRGLSEIEKRHLYTPKVERT